MSTVPRTRSLAYVLREQLARGGIAGAANSLRQFIAPVHSVPDDGHVTIDQAGTQVTIRKLRTYQPVIGEGAICLADQTSIVAVGTANPAGTAGGGGDQGPPGPPGAQGPQGDPGATGPQGPPGTAGAAGATGPQGAKGDPGTAGAAGAAGPQGAKGDPGATGTTGPQGPAGATGPQGPAGAAGSMNPTAVAQPTRALGAVYQPNATKATMVIMILGLASAGGGTGDEIAINVGPTNPPTVTHVLAQHKFFGTGTPEVLVPATFLVPAGWYVQPYVAATASVGGFPFINSTTELTF